MARYAHTDYAREELVTHFESAAHLFALATAPGLSDAVRGALKERNRERRLEADQFFRGVLQSLGTRPSWTEWVREPREDGERAQ